MNCKNCGHSIWRNKVNPNWAHSAVAGIYDDRCYDAIKKKICGCTTPEPSERVGSL